jgi:ABC-2 type transport system ATP-binding protein
MPVIEIRGLTKQYPVPLKREAVNAVDNLNLTVEEGEIFGFLGPNGAGKTTTIKTLLGLIYPTAGEAWVLGAPAGDISVKHQIAYLPESPYFYEHLTAREVVRFYAQLFGMAGAEAARRADELLDLVGLQADSRKSLRQFSKGMLQRVGIAQSLINNPKLLFYDEPTSGLDPIAHRDIRDLILRLKEQGKTIFLSSHQLSDVEMVCDRVSIIHRGVLRKLGRVEDLIAGGQVEIVATGLHNGLAEKIRAAAPQTEFVDSKTIITQPDDDAAVARIVDLIRGGQGHIVSITPKRRTLEDIFVETVTDRIGRRAPQGDGVVPGAAPMAPPSSEEANTAGGSREVVNK